MRKHKDLKLKLRLRGYILKLDFRINILTSCQDTYILINMKVMSVGKLKTHFSEVLDQVKRGQKVGVLYGRAKKPVAMIVPYQEEKKDEREIGILDGKAKIQFHDNFEMTAEELCNL